MSYYGYVAPDINKEVNWAKIGTDFADMLNKGEQDREKKRQEIDKTTDEFIKTVNNAPQGQYKRLNEWTLDYASDVKKSMLLINKELKAGRLKPDDFIKYRQNLTDGTNSIFGLSKTFQEEYDQIEKRRISKEGSYAETWVGATVEKLGRFSESKPVINPTDYNVYVGQLVDGKLDTNPNNLQSPAVLTGLLKTRYDAFKVIDKAKVIADAAGKEIQVVDRGAIRRLLDITKRRDLSDVDKSDKAIGLYLRLEDAAISSALSDPDAIMSTLVDTKLVNQKTGNAYELTSDPNDPGIKTGDKIYMEFDKGSGRYISKPTEEQIKVAKNTMRDAIRYQLDREEEGKAQFAPTSRGTGTGPKPEDDTATTMLRYLYSGDNAQMQLAKNYFEDRGAFIERTGTAVTVMKKDKDGQPQKFVLDFLSIGDGKPLPEDEWVASAAPVLAGEYDVDAAIRKGGKRGALGRLNTETKFTTAPAAGPSREQEWNNEVKRLIPTVKGGNTRAASNTVADLSSKFGRYGFTFKNDGPEITISTPSSGDITVDTSEDGFATLIYNAIRNGLTGDDLKSKFKKASAYNPQK